MFRRLVPLFLAAPLMACSGSTTDSGMTKQQASQRTDSAGEDVCAEMAWYGDGECDTFCPDADTDCAQLPGDPVVCASFVEQPDGACSRPADDVCLMQDPDCGSGTEPSDPNDPVVCALYIEESDGVCRRAEDDPCRSQDPDCTTACRDYLEQSDGACSREPNDPCISQDPDCSVACDMYLEEPDKVCSRSPDDPCMFQDPDCDSGGDICLMYIEDVGRRMQAPGRRCLPIPRSRL